MMLGDAELIALFRLRDEADVRLDMRLFARTLWDLKAHTGVLSVANISCPSPLGISQINPQDLIWVYF